MWALVFCEQPCRIICVSKWATYMCLKASLVHAAESGIPFVEKGSGMRAKEKERELPWEPVTLCLSTMMLTLFIETRSAKPAADVLAWAGCNLRSEQGSACKGNALS